MKQLLTSIAIFLFFLLTFTTFAQTTFNYTGTVQTYTVPAGVTTIWIDMQGATGGYEVGSNTLGGAGGRTQAALTVVPGTIIYVYVGGVGDSSSAQDTISGGFNGGGASFGTGDGGGASDIRIGGTALTNRMIVAGGGGGAGVGSDDGYNIGGNGGGLTGGNGLDCGIVDSGSGLGGTQTTGGAGAFADSSGGFGFGGHAFIPPGGSGVISGGGGGGGYYGGGCGGLYHGACFSDGGAGGGGGGSSYTDASATDVILTSGYNTAGNGIVKIYTRPVSVSQVVPPDPVINIYPNPANNQLTIQGAQNCDITLYDMVGRPVIAQITSLFSSRPTSLSLGEGRGEAHIDISTLNTGIYTIEITQQDTGIKIIKKLIKMD